MKLGIMQPYFYPYLGYFALIKNTQKWIVFDTVQYIEHGWINRNRIIHPNKPESIYFTIPLQKHSRETVIKDILIDQGSPYKEKILGQLIASYKKRAPYFQCVYSLVEEALSQNFLGIVELNVFTMKQVCKYLNISFDYDVFSRMHLNIAPVYDAGEWALNISTAVKASEYINPPGGIELFDNKKFTDAGIALNFLKIHLQPYNQKKACFIDGLSIIDVMMFNSPEQICKMLDDYELIPGNSLSL